MKHVKYSCFCKRPLYINIDRFLNSFSFTMYVGIIVNQQIYIYWFVNSRCLSSNFKPPFPTFVREMNTSSELKPSTVWDPEKPANPQTMSRLKISHADQPWICLESKTSPFTQAKIYVSVYLTVVYPNQQLNGSTRMLRSTTQELTVW